MLPTPVLLKNLADSLLNQGLFIGRQVDAGPASAASDMTITITHATGEATQLEGHHPSADPRAPLYWLAEFFCAAKAGGCKPVKP
ncbi:hypothetical protein ACFS07_15075 [Undibacterium arcticum]